MTESDFFFISYNIHRFLFFCRKKSAYLYMEISLRSGQLVRWKNIQWEENLVGPEKKGFVYNAEAVTQIKQFRFFPPPSLSKSQCLFVSLCLFPVCSCVPYTITCLLLSLTLPKHHQQSIRCLKWLPVPPSPSYLLSLRM